MNKTPLIQCQQLCKSFHDGTQAIDILKGIDFKLHAGERIAIIGPSGSGKSTFLHVLSGLDHPTAGQVWIGEKNWQHLSERQRCQTRNAQLGFVYQFHHLLPEFTALENVAMPLLLRGETVVLATAKATAMLAEVGLEKRLTHKPAQLSGGERQRVAIARALVHQPRCVVADEPTGNLDEATARQSFELMLALNHATNTALLVVTHDQTLAAQMDRVYLLKEGQLSLSLQV